MFSKTKKKNRGRWSIVSRLVTLYAVVTIMILALSSLSLHWILAKNLENSDVVFLRNEISSIGNILKLHIGDWNALTQELVWAPESQDNTYYARVILPTGRVVIQTPKMTKKFPEKIWPHASPKTRQISPSELYDSSDGGIYLLMSQWIHVQNAQHQEFLVQVALNVSRDQVLLLKYGHDLIVVSLIAILFSLLFSYWVAKSGLSPLRSIARQIERITASRLSTRINPSKLPKELTLLAGSFNNVLKRMEKSFEDLSAFSSNLAHEVRTPINNLIGETELALRSKRTDKEYLELLGSNLEEYDRLSRIVERLLFLARAENNRMALSASTIDVKKEFQAIFEFQHAVAQEKDINLTFKGKGTVQADITLFRRAVNNLVSNALKYTPEHGKVVLSAESLNEKFLRIMVTDNGEGIPTKDLPHIFERFYRVDRQRSKDSGGTGLGLAIVKSIVEIHGGKIEIKSKLNKGTKIWMDWPT